MKLNIKDLVDYIDCIACLLACEFHHLRISWTINFEWGRDGQTEQEGLHSLFQPEQPHRHFTSCINWVPGTTEPLVMTEVNQIYKLHK